MARDVTNALRPTSSSKSVLHRLWSPKSVSIGNVSAISFVLLLGGLLLTFPPFMDFLQGK